MARPDRPVAGIEERRLLAIGLVLVGYFLFAITDSFAKWLSQSGIPTIEVVAVRYAGQLLLISVLLIPKQGATVLRTKSLGLEILRGLCLLGSTLGNFFALTYLPLTITASINFTMPFVLCALSVPLLGEVVGWRRWLAICVGFIGVLIIVRPGTEAFSPAVFFSLVGVVFSAFYFLLTRRLAGVDAPGTQQFYAGLVATLCVLPFAIGGWIWPGGWDGWFSFAMIGLAALIGHQFVTIAHRYAPASVLAPFNYSLIVYLTISSWLVFNQPPDASIFIGAPIVIGSGLYIWLRERQLAANKEHLAEPRLRSDVGPMPVEDATQKP
ncbi:MAG: Permease of the drug/metabolite transporter superfamily [Devosia sp.]|nr:Permease of the drug/metabolite transporter superfamily [Devosia sp.]